MPEYECIVVIVESVSRWLIFEEVIASGRVKKVDLS